MTVRVTTFDAAAIQSRTAAVPWFLYAVLFASTSVLVGVLWDISWHQSIGRDTFWTPAHLGIYLGGIVAGLTCGSLALRTTFAATPDRARRRGAVLGFGAARGAGVVWGTRDAHLGALTTGGTTPTASTSDPEPAARAARLGIGAIRPARR